MRLMLLISLCILCGSCVAQPSKVCDLTVNIPPPQGFAKVVPDMTKIDAYYSRYLNPGTRRLGTYIPEAVVADALAENFPVHHNYFTVEVAESMVGRPLEESGWIAFKDSLKRNTEVGADQVLRSVNKITDAANQSQLKESDIELALNVLSVVNLHPHHEDERSVSYSVLTKREFQIDDEVVEDVGVTTGTAVYVQNCAILLFSYGSGQEDLERTRNWSKRWASAIIDANESR